MSVTFSVENPTIGYRVSTYCGADQPMVATHDEGVVELLRHRQNEAQGQPMPGCTCEWSCEPELHAVGIHDDAPSVNMNNLNAADLLVALGLNTDNDELLGTIPGVELQERVLMAELTTAPDPGRLPVAVGRTVTCGREPGYVQDKLAEIRGIANYAVEHGLSVSWG